MFLLIDPNTYVNVTQVVGMVRNGNLWTVHLSNSLTFDVDSVIREKILALAGFFQQ